MLQGSAVMHHHCAKPLHNTAFGSHRPLLVVPKCRSASWLGSKQVHLQTFASNADVASAAVVKDRQHLAGDGLVFPVGEPGSWDEAGVGSPVVRCYFGDDEERWLMWYSGRSEKDPSLDLITPSSGSLGVAVSRDGVTWQRGKGSIEGNRGGLAASDVGSILTPNGDWWTFDTCHMSMGDVQVLSNSSVQSGVGVYWGFYSGGDFQPIEVPPNLPGAAAAGAGGKPLEGLRLRPGLAMSQDGRNWARIEGDHHSGALFDVGAPGEWDELFVGQPQVLAVGPRDMRMYYHSWDVRQGRFIVGCATSPDGFRWTRRGPVFDTRAAGAKAGDHDELGAGARHVVRDVDNRQYLMFYEAVAATGARSVGLAVSQDGYKWERCPHPVLTPSTSNSSTTPPAGQQPAAAASGASQPGEGQASTASSTASSSTAGVGSSSTSGTSSTGAWDCGSVGAPCAVSMSAGRWRLYYAGSPHPQPGPWLGIGLALSDDKGPTFKGVPTSFRRRKAAPQI